MCHKMQKVFTLHLRGGLPFTSLVKEVQQIIVIIHARTKILFLSEKGYATSRPDLKSTGNMIQLYSLLAYLIQTSRTLILMSSWGAVP
jgi:hypothetical protein